MNVRSSLVTVFVVRPTAAGSYDFLQLKRAPHKSLPGTWQTIRGGIETGEIAGHAALREMREESGLSPIEFYRLGIAETFYLDLDDAIWIAPAFCGLVSADAQVRLNDENDAFRWISRDAILSHTLWASERVLLPHLFADILDNGPAKPLLRVKLNPDI